jgi:hypothetical protein
MNRVGGAVATGPSVRGDAERKVRSRESRSIAVIYYCKVG